MRGLWLAEFLGYGREMLLAAGDGDGAEELAQERETLSHLWQDPEVQLTTRHAALERVWMDGQLELAVAEAQTLAALGEELGSPVRGRLAAWLVGFWPALWLGRSELVVSLADERLGSEATGNHLGWRGVWLAHQGRFDEARTHLQHVLGELEISDAAPTRLLVHLLETAVLVGDQRSAALLAPTLHDVPGVTIPVAAVARHVAGAERLLGNHASARTRYESALDWATKIHFRPEIALTRLGLAELLFEGMSEEQKQAQTHLDFAIAEFRAMKMQPSLERALRHKGLLKA
jgi:hypothetical protein